MFKFLYFFVFLNFLSFSCLPTEPVKDWTIYIHMNGNNNLCPYAKKNLKDLESVNASSVANIIVGYTCNEVGKAKIMLVKGAQETILDSGKIDFGDYNTVIKYAKMAYEKYPSKYKMVIIWNHGNGVEDTWNGKSEVSRWVSLDEITNHVITTEELGTIVSNLGQKTDIMGFDACLMQMVEISYEMKDYVSYVAASEATEPGDGWDYASIAKALLKHPDPISLGKTISTSYVEFNDSASDLTFSLVDVKKQSDFVDLFKEYIKVDSNKTKLYSALNKASYYTYSYKDLGEALKTIGNSNLLKSYNDSVIFNANNGSAGSGFSIYYTTYPENLYFNTKFAKYTNWLSEYNN